MKRRAGASAAPANPDSPDAAYVAAIKKLARQPQSRAALGQKLERQGYAADAVSTALDRAQAEGYLDDGEYAQSVVRRRSASRGYGLIAQELRAKGVEDEAAGPALETVDREAQLSHALTLGRSLLAHRAPADRQALQTWVGPRLSRRGFDSGLVYRVCRQLGDEWEAGGRFDSP
ncbi:MAG: recombination regulator RecX [Candidatus Dormibacteraeota bacterium]|nr:recombination regulator RecX [Candidatus Dormibacteraeota bacterium]